MKVFTSLESCVLEKAPVVLTIGNFDGVHLGHQALLGRVFDLAGKLGGSSCVVTFANHPVEVFRPETQVFRLCSPVQKLKYLELLGCDVAVVLKFTLEFASQSAEIFLSSLTKAMPITHLILGHDAVIGKGRAGDRGEIARLSEKMGFTLEYLDAFHVDELSVSSGLIRQAIKNGDFCLAERLLGRRYSLQYPLVGAICLPPSGEYRVLLKHNETEEVKGIRVEGQKIFLNDKVLQEGEIFF